MLPVTWGGGGCVTRYEREQTPAGESRALTLRGVTHNDIVFGQKNRKYIVYIVYIYKGVRAWGLPPPRLFPFPQGCWGSGENGDADVPSAKECPVAVDGVVFEM